MKILALMPDSYGGRYGIAQYNRDLFDALSSVSCVDEVLSLPRLFPESNASLPKKIREQPLPGNASRYLLEAVRLGLILQPGLILCGHINLLPLAVILKKITGAPTILQVYGIEVWQAKGSVRPKIMENGSVRRWLIGKVDLVITISRYTEEQLLRWSGLPAHKLKLIPNAIHLEQYTPGDKPAYLVKRYGIEGKRVLLTMSRIEEPYKGHDRIIILLPQLVRRFPNLIYLVAGDGSDRGRLEALAARAGMREYVIFAGQIPEKEKLDHYHLADAFALPSTGEGFGFVFLEAAASGLPVLGGSKDGSRDALMDGVLGVMVDPNNAQELLSGLETILERGKQVPKAIQRFAFSNFKREVEDLLVMYDGKQHCKRTNML